LGTKKIKNQLQEWLFSTNIACIHASTLWKAHFAVMIRDPLQSTTLAPKTLCRQEWISVEVY